MNLWPHQTRAIDNVASARADGHRRILLSSPTGGGKTRIMLELARQELARGGRVAIYYNRKLLIEQAAKTFQMEGLPFGVRAAGWADERYRPLQLCSIQTEASRTWEHHPATLFMVDEAHLHTGDMATAIFGKHHADDATGVGVTATPIDMGNELWDILIQAGVTSELRECGALVRALHYSCDEPDMKGIKWKYGEELTEAQNTKAIMRHGVFGRVLEWWKRLNPEQKPTLLFAPGVKESLWFAEEFEKAGYGAAHIDGEDVWLCGKLYKSSPEMREKVVEASRIGAIKVICNRFVLREGIDLPWLAHGIFATVFGALKSYLQSGGRLLRAFPGMEGVCIQDHGGNFWRHGSLNADRHWELGETENRLAGMREQAMRDNPPIQPYACPKCGMVSMSGVCPACGWRSEKRSRMVVQTDGTLVEVKGDYVAPRRIDQSPSALEIWTRIYWRAKRSRNKMTFRQAEALYCVENYGKFPPRDMPLMPRREVDWYRRVCDVPMSELRS